MLNVTGLLKHLVIGRARRTVVVLSYRRVVSAYPSDGSSYEVVSTNLGPSAGWWSLPRSLSTTS